MATLLGKGAPPEDVQAFVTAEVGQLLDVGRVILVRYDSDGAATTVGAWAEPASPPFAVGAPLRVGGQNVTTQVFETGRAARSDDLGAEVLRSHVQSVVTKLRPWEQTS